MSNRNWIPVRGAQGVHSRQAHADMPDGTYEREVSKEGFFGPAAFFHHRHPPTTAVVVAPQNHEAGPQNLEHPPQDFQYRKPRRRPQ